MNEKRSGLYPQCIYSTGTKHWLCDSPTPTKPPQYLLRPDPAQHAGFDIRKSKKQPPCLIVVYFLFVNLFGLPFVASVQSLLLPLYVLPSEWCFCFFVWFCQVFPLSPHFGRTSEVFRSLRK